MIATQREPGCLWFALILSLATLVYSANWLASSKILACLQKIKWNGI